MLGQPDASGRGGMYLFRILPEQWNAAFTPMVNLSTWIGLGIDVVDLVLSTTPTVEPVLKNEQARGIINNYQP